MTGDAVDELVRPTGSDKGADPSVEPASPDLTPVGMPTVVGTHVLAPITVTVVAAGTRKSPVEEQQDPGSDESNPQQY